MKIACRTFALDVTDAAQVKAAVKIPVIGNGDIACFNPQTKHRTPNLDRLAAEGMRFTQHYSGAPVCAPSRNVLMTGLHTGHTGRILSMENVLTTARSTGG